MEIHQSASKHGVKEDDILLALGTAIAEVELGEDPDKAMYIGFSRGGALLEIVVLTLDSGRQIAIHAMTARQKNLKEAGLV